MVEKPNKGLESDTYIPSLVWTLHQWRFNPTDAHGWLDVLVPTGIYGDARSPTEVS